MKSRREGDPRERLRLRRDEFDEEDARLPAPAGAARVVLGIVALVSGFLLGALAGDGRRAWAGIVVMLLSPIIMLRWPKK